MVKRKAIKGKFNKKLIPLMLMMVVPFIMYYQYIEYDTVITKPYFVTAEYYYDLFSFNKTIAIYIIAVLCIIFYVIFTKNRDMILKKERIKFYIPVAIYALFIIISTIFSIYPRVAIFGVYERYEGALVLIAYLIFMIYAIEVIRDEIDLNYIFSVFLGLVFILSLIGVMQKYFIDIFSIGFFQRLVGIPEGALIETHFHNWAYATLYNPNNLGQFAALTAPITAGLMLALKSKKMKIFAAITLILSVIAGVASSSANFFAGIFAAAVVFVLLYISHFIPRNKILKILLFVLVGVCLVGLFTVRGKIKNRILQTSFVQSEIKSVFPPKDDVYFENISITTDLITFETTQGVFYLRYMERGISFYDSEYNYIDFTQKGDNITFIEEPYKTQWRITITSEHTMTVRAKRSYSYTYIEIVFDETKFLGIRGTGGRILHDIMENQMPEKFRGLETIASRRGYLWLVTMSRLDEVLFIGAGPDNFLYWFEQNDVIGKANFLHKTSILADKPHNWYLQIASQTGVISLIAFITMMGIYIVSSIKLIGFRRKKNYYEFVSSGILCGLIGYMVSSIFADSTVGVTPIFFAFLGIGIMVNEQLKEIRYKDKNLNKSKKSLS